MGDYRINSIAELARQMDFMPITRRLEQLNSVEELLLKLNADSTYTISDITVAITGYEPRKANNDALAGIALQHDLGVLLEEVADSLQLHVNSSAEPILTIEEVAQRLGVTTKTVQRWRRRGLPARRYTFADNKRRVGFRFSSVQRFVGSATVAAEALEEVKPQRSVQWLLDAAHRLADAGYWQSLAAQRLSSAAGVSAVALARILAEQGANIAFATEPSPEVRARVVEKESAGDRLARVAACEGMPVYGAYRIVLEHKLTAALRKRINFHDDALYHGENAAAAIEEILSQQTAEPVDVDAMRPARDIPPYLRDLYRIEPLTATRERGLFLKYHYLRCLAAAEQKNLDTQASRYSDLRRFDTLRRDARIVRAKIVEANLRLVVSVARKHLRPSLSLMDLVSEGNLTLIRAVDGFDIHRGTRFSTYAVYALMRAFARYVPAILNGQRSLTDPEHFSEVGDPSSSRPAEEALARDEVLRLLQHLDRREREVLSGRFGLDQSSAPLTCRELGERMSLSSQRVTQIERDALEKLRLLAANAGSQLRQPAL